MTRINAFTTFKIILSANLSSDDIRTLSLLYSPIIGSDGLALYLALYSLVDRQKMTSELMPIKEILDIVNFKLQDFETAKNKLEALALARSFRREDEYLFYLNIPLSANVFMSGDLGPFLYSKLGEGLFRKLYKSFVIEKINRDGYQEITHSFDDVFESKNIVIRNDDLLLERKTGIVKFINADFDMDSYLNGMKTFVDRRRFTEKFKNQILRLAYTYGFDFQEMINLSVASMNGDMIDGATLNKRSREFYQNKNKIKAPSLELKTNPVDNNDGASFLDQTTPKEILESLSGMGASVAELNTINELWEKTGWDKGVINGFLTYILKKKDGKLPSFNYLDKVASEWKRMNLNTTKDVVQYLESNIDSKEDDFLKDEKCDWLIEWYKKVGGASNE